MKWQTIELNEVIYVWHHSEDSDPDHYPQDFFEKDNHNLSLKGSIVTENAADLQHFHYVHQKLMPYMPSIASFKFSFDRTYGTETRPTLTGRMTICLVGVELATLHMKVCHVSPVTELIYFGTEDSMMGTIDSDAMIFVNNQTPKCPIFTRNDEAIVRYRRFCQKFYTK
ncbi:unnamed protein product, partial [Medioppia subpectinata]